MSIIYNITTLGLAFTLPIWFYKTSCAKKARVLLIPLYLLLLVIILKHVLLAAEYGGPGFLSPSFFLPYPGFPEGFYFINLSRWLSIGSLMMWIVYEVDSKNKLNQCLKVSSIAILLPIILMIVRRPDLIGFRQVSIDDVNFGGGFWNLGVRAFLAFGWLWLLMYFDKSQPNRILFLASAVTVILSGLFGISRSALIAISIGLLFYVLFNTKSARPLKIIAAVVICLSLMYLLSGASIIDNFIARFGSLNDIMTIEEEPRYVIWKNYLYNINEYALIGAPIGSYLKYAIPPKYCSPHSSPLFWFVQYGMFGLISYLSLFWNTVSKALSIKEKDTSRNIIIWLVTYMCLTFINEVGYYTIESYIGLALILALVKICLTVQDNVSEGSKHTVCE
ncbi:O-antigen ligase family protein [Ruminiclostridium sufflavum]|nr:O-antigen ligase family protein [Ruminiclostridium sufflavum]